VRRVSPALALVLCVAALAAPIACAATGSIEGRVIDRHTGEALFPADVVVVGTTLGGIASRDGRFTIRDVPEGAHRVRASMMGYELDVRDVVVAADRAIRLDFELTPDVLDIGLDVVIAAKHFEKDGEKPVSFRSLIPEEMRRAPGSVEDVFRVVQSMPGVSPVDMTTSNLVVRGGDPSENRTLLENIEIPNPVHFARPGGTIGSVSVISPGLLERVDFLTGGFPAKYGDRISSVFEMKLRDGNRASYSTDLNLNLAGFSFALDGPAPGGGTMLCSVRRGVFDLLTPVVGLQALPAYWDLVGKLTYDIGSSNRLSLIGVYYPDDLELAADPEEEERHGEWPELDLDRHDYGGAVGLNWRCVFGERAYLLTTAAHVTNGWTTKRGTYVEPALVGDDIREDETDLKTELTYRVSDRLNVRTGVFWETIRSHHTAWSIADTANTGHVIPAFHVTSDPPPTYKTGSYAQATVRPTGRLSLTGGLRYDYYDLTGESNSSPRLGLSLGLTDRTSLNVAYGHYYQTAAPHQVALHPSNTALKSSRSVHYIVGLEHLLSDATRMSVEAYHKELDDAFVESYATGEVTNEGSGYARGVEFYLQRKMAGNLVGSVAYTYSISMRQDGDDLSEYYSEYDRPHNLTLVGSYRFSDSWQVGARFQYATGNPYTPAAGVEERGGEWFVLQGARNSARCPDYHMLDVRVDRTFRFKGWTLMGYLDLWNIYGRQNVTWYGYGVDESGTLTKINANEGMSEMIPILGLEVAF